MTRRRWIADRWEGNSAALVDAQAAHLSRVLRAQVGQEFEIVAGNTVRRGIVEKISANVVEFSLHENVDTNDSLLLVIALSIVRFERMEWAIEKLTELGAAEIIPLIAERSEKHLVQAAAKRTERWHRIAHEAAQQSRRSRVPEITMPMSLAEVLAASRSPLKLLLSEQERTRTLWESLMTTEANSASLSAIEVAIGPEGGWTTAELRKFSETGWTSLSLGPQILRTETAAVAVASLIGGWWSGANGGAKETS